MTGPTGSLGTDDIDPAVPVEQESFAALSQWAVDCHGIYYVLDAGSLNGSGYLIINDAYDDGGWSETLPVQKPVQLTAPAGVDALTIVNATCSTVTLTDNAGHHLTYTPGQTTWTTT